MKSKTKRTNVTFSVSPKLLREARKHAVELDLSLNDAFLEWLEQFAKGPSNALKIENLFKTLSHVNAGRRFSREESYE